MENTINFNIPDEVIAEVSEGLAIIVNRLQPYLIALTPEQRHDLPKMSDRTIPFVEKTLAYAQSSPQFAPPYMDVEALLMDMKVHGQLTPLFRMVKQLCDGLDDTTMEAGAESFVNALSYYNSVKQAAKMNVPGAKAIYEDLQKRFERKSKTTEPVV
jgi:hypothetical protein